VTDEQRDQPAQSPDRGALIAAPTGWCGQARSGSGRFCARRTAPSTPRITPTCMPGRSGSTRPRSNPPPCSRAPPAPGRCTRCTRDSTGAYLDGSKPYTLDVPQHVPAGLFWSLTVYDARTRSEIRTDQNQAAIRSMFELAGAPATLRRWGGRHLDSDTPQRGLVRLLPYLRPRRARLRRHLAAPRLPIRLTPRLRKRRVPAVIIRSCRRGPARSKRRRLTRVWAAAQDGLRAWVAGIRGRGPGVQRRVRGVQADVRETRRPLDPEAGRYARWLAPGDVPARARAWTCEFMLFDLARRCPPTDLAPVRQALDQARAAVAGQIRVTGPG
jgi:Protein of unknown function (DUF1214)